MSSPYLNIDTSSQEMTTVSFCQDLDGKFTGALMPMAHPLDTANQWQSLMEGLVINAIQIDPEANLNGLYVFSWWSEKGNERKGQDESAIHSGLLFTRLTEKVTTEEIAKVSLPEKSLGLFSLSDAMLGEKVAVLAISGYVSASSGALRSDRIFGTVVTPDNKLSKEINDKMREHILHLGELLNTRLNSNISSRQNTREQLNG